MSFIRPSTEAKYSEMEKGRYVFQGDGFIRHYGGLEDPETLCETVFRILEQSGVEVTDEMVDKVRERMGLP